MRVGLLTASFDPVIGGAETYALNVAEGLSALGHQVMVVTDTPHGVEEDAPDPVRRPFAVRRLFRYRRRLFDPQKLPWEEMGFALSTEIKDALDDFRPDVLMSNSLDTAIQAAIIRRAMALPWVAAFHEHAPELEPFGEGRMATVYGDLRPDAVIAGSEFYAARARKWGPTSAVHMVHHGVPMVDTTIQDRNRWRMRYGLTDDHQLIVCVGRLKERKGIRELLAAFSALRPRERNLRLVVAGTVSSASADYFDALRRLRSELGYEDLVTFDETVVADKVPYLMSAADIVAQPSYEEGLGLAVLEAMAARRPVVTTRVRGINEIVTRPGLVLQVEAGDVGELAGALDRLITDSDLRARLARAGHKQVESAFSLQAMAVATADVLTGVRSHVEVSTSSTTADS